MTGTPRTPMARETFQVLVADRSIELVRDGDRLLLGGRVIDVSLEETAPDHFSLLVDGRSLRLFLERSSNGVTRLRTDHGLVMAEVIGNRERLLRSAGGDSGRAARSAPLKAPMPGLIVKVLVEPGATVKTGDALVVLEAMKMENEIRAGHDGRVGTVHVSSGDAVSKNDLMIEFEDV